MADVLFHEVRKSYPSGVVALDGLNLQVADGELLVLIGPSGCGKTTTLRVLAGLETVTQGTIHMGGQDVTRLPPRLRDTALVFQRPTLYPHLSVADNLALSDRLRQNEGWWTRLLHGRARRLREQERATRVREVARQLGLEGVLTRRPEALSGGQQQRVALGRALVRQPAVFLLDEPLSNLEPHLRQEMRRELHLLQRRLRATMIYVTHDQVEAMTLGDRVVVLDSGRIRQVGPPLDLYRQPADTMVARFLGWPPMNLISGHLGRTEQGRLAFLIANEVWPLAERFSPGALKHVGQEVLLGLRPEHIAWGSAKEQDPGHVVRRAEVVLAESLGATRVVSLQENERTWMVMGPEGPDSPRDGDVLEMAMDLTQAHLFDRATGRSLAPVAPFG